MNKFSAAALIAASLLTTGAAFAAEPAQKTRAEVIAELQQARESGEVAALSAEQAGVSALENGVNAPTASQIAAAKKAAAEKTATKGGASTAAASSK